MDSTKTIQTSFLVGYFLLGIIVHSLTARCIVLSSAPSVITHEECPMPSLEKEISKALDKYKINPENKAQIRRLIGLLSKTIPTYDCRRNYDKKPIPAWWLADDDSIANWFAFLLDRVKRDDELALKLLVQFYATSDGYFKEGLSYRLIEIFLSQPALVLECWTYMRVYREKITEFTVFLRPEDGARMVTVYHDLGAKNKDFKQQCDEIIEIVKKGQFR